MITKHSLEDMRQINIGDVSIENLKDISEVTIDTKKPVEERILSFIEQIGNPYLFKVGNTPVKVGFNGNGSTLQKCLEILFTQCR
ncbi:hypothetical protein FACS1894211_08500 [Clostridia bacterium]|nr:hypothetical protein FACS1894211_08500 [Clostridia bacterium]